MRTQCEDRSKESEGYRAWHKQNFGRVNDIIKQTERELSQAFNY